jgi:hypothetical protein
MAILKPKERLLLSQKYNGKCAYCGCLLEDRFHADHIEPVSQGGTKYVRKKDVLTHYNPSCARCNTSKGSSSLIDWKLRLYKYALTLCDNGAFAILLRVGKIKIHPNPIVFYFEKEPNSK